MLITLHINGEEERRIDWVGEPNHSQPQDPAPNTPERLRSWNDGRLAPIFNNIIDENDNDLQQRQKPIFPFKGTYLEFTEQQTLKP